MLTIPNTNKKFGLDRVIQVPDLSKSIHIVYEYKRIPSDLIRITTSDNFKKGIFIYKNKKNTELFNVRVVGRSLEICKTPYLKKRKIKSFKEMLNQIPTWDDFLANNHIQISQQFGMCECLASIKIRGMDVKLQGIGFNLHDAYYEMWITHLRSLKLKAFDSIQG